MRVKKIDLPVTGGTILTNLLNNPSISKVLARDGHTLLRQSRFLTNLARTLDTLLPVIDGIKDTPAFERSPDCLRCLLNLFVRIRQ